MRPRAGIFALEALEGLDDSLALVQELTKDEETKASGEYDAMHVAISDKLESMDEVDVTAATAADDDVPADDDAPSTTDGDETAPPEDTPPVEDPPGKEKDTDSSTDPEADKEDALSSVVTESLRDTYYDRVILEAINFDDVVNAVSTVGRVGYETASYAAKRLYEFSEVLVGLGIKYAPGAAAKMRKGVVYLYTKSAKALLGSVLGINSFVKRYASSIQGTKKDIATLREVVATLRASNRPLALTTSVCKDSKAIAWFSHAGRVDPLGSAKVVGVFMDAVIKNIDGGVSSDLAAVKKLIDLSKTGFRGNTLGFLNVAPFSGNFLRKTVKGYVKDPDRVDSLVYASPLPNNVLFISNLPRPGLKTMDEVTAAYQDSGMFLAVDSQYRTLTEEINYMDLPGIEKLLDVLDSLCAGAMTRMALYARIEKQCGELKFGYQHYYQSLTESPQAATVHNSLVEFVFLKQNFINKVYLPAAMDIHDYVAAYLVHAVRFAKQNLKQLAPVPEEPPASS